MMSNQQYKSFEDWIAEIFRKPWKKWADDPKSLATLSLVSPYFVGRFLPKDSLGKSNEQLGQAFLNAMREVYLSYFWKGNCPQDSKTMLDILETVPDKTYKYYDAMLLELYFFRDYVESEDARLRGLYVDSISKIENKVRPSRTTLWRHSNDVISKFAKALLDFLGPSSRTIAPRPENIVGTDPLLIQLLSWLDLKQTVNLSGPGGVGKSTLAVLAAYAWPCAMAWSTIWTGLEQPLDRLLFELGHLLGTPKFWEEVLSVGRIVHDKKTLESLYDDLWICQQENDLTIQGLVLPEGDKIFDLDAFLKVEVLENACAQVRRCKNYAWPKTAFLYTIRPNLNDRLNTFLFELGHFLHQQGNSNLWKLILLHNGNIEDSNLARAMLIDDLRSCQSQPPLLIIDEVDRLHAIDSILTKPHHDDFLTFLESLRREVPLLLIGQRTVLESDAYLDLDGLVPFQIAELLQMRGIQTSFQDIERLHQVTGGNPRLLTICIAIYERERVGGVQNTFANIVDTISQTSRFAPYVNRLWERLNPRQRELLQRLSVYLDDAPEQYGLVDDDEKLNKASETLLELQIVQQKGLGAVALLPAMREYIYNEKLTPDKRLDYHLDAAILFSQLAQYTDAAYHFNLGGEPTKAIQLWFPVMEDEIKRGQTDAAYNIFINMPYRNLPEDEADILKSIQSRLYELYGELQQGLDVLNLLSRQIPSELAIENLELRGTFEAALGYPYLAQQTYQDSIELIARLSAQKAIVHCRIGTNHIRRNEMTEIERTALEAEQEVLMLRGLLAGTKGELAIADEIYRKALKLARELDNIESIALSHARISDTQRMMGNFEEAVFQAEQAKIHYERMGNRLESTRLDNTIAGIYLDAGNYEKAISVGEKAANFFDRIQDSHFASTTFSTVAEAYFYLGRHEDAEEIAYKALAYEEPFTMPYAHYTLGLVNQVRKEYEMAISHFERSLDIAVANEYKFIEAFTRLEYGRTLCLAGDIPKGKDELENARRLFEELGNSREEKVVQELLDKY